MKDTVYIKDLIKDKNMLYLYNTMYKCADKVGIAKLAVSIARSIDKYKR